MSPRPLRPARPRRAPPRPPEAATRERLLDAAERLFAARGVLATPVRDITREAGCNVAAVNYYFGGKDNLYREMFRRRVVASRDQRLAVLRRALDDAGEGPTLELIVRTFTHAFLESLTEDERGGRLMQLVSRELLEPHLPPGLLVEELVEPTYEALQTALRRVCPSLDPRAGRLCIQSLIAQLSHAAHWRRIWENAPSGRMPRVSYARFVDHVVRFTSGGVRACAEEAKQ